MDRYELMRMALEQMLAEIKPDRHDVTVLWQDGSQEKAALNFFEHFSTSSVRLIKQGGTVRNIGADRVIERGMAEIQKLGTFDWFGTVESDVYLVKNWLSECLQAAEEAKKVGFRPGIVTPYVLRCWVAEYHPTFVSMSACGAACSLFIPEAWALVPPREVACPFNGKLLSDYGFPMVHKRHYNLGYDWCFAPSVYHGGFDVIGTRFSKLFNCGCNQKDKSVFKDFSYIEESDSKVWQESGSTKLAPRDYESWRYKLGKAVMEAKVKASQRIKWEQRMIRFGETLKQVVSKV